MIFGAAVRHIFIGALVGAGMAGCAGAPEFLPHTHYGLQPELQAVGATAGQPVFIVEPVQIEGVMAGRPLVRLIGEKPLRLREVEGHMWHVAPRHLIQTALARALDGNGAGARFLLADSGVDGGDFRVRAQISEFFWTPEADNGARMRVTVSVENLKTRQIVMRTTYLGEAAVTADTAQDGVMALEIALSDIAAQFARDLSELN